MPRDIRSRTNLALVFFALLLHGGVFLAAPLVLLPRSPLYGLFLIPVVLHTLPLWYLAHEAFHRNLHPHARANDLLGRLLGVLFGAPFGPLRFGHLMHHRYNGAPIDRPDLYDPRRTGRLEATVRYFLNLCGGFYLLELLSGPAALLPRPLWRRLIERQSRRAGAEEREILQALAETVSRPAVRWAWRAEALAALSFWGFALWAYRAEPGLLLLVLAGRAVLVSTANNLPHYGTDPRQRLYALNLHLPGWLAGLVLHFNRHRVHHRQPLLPWHRLASAHRASGEGYDLPWMQAFLRQFRGPTAWVAAGDGQPRSQPTSASCAAAASSTARTGRRSSR